MTVHTHARRLASAALGAAALLVAGAANANLTYLQGRTFSGTGIGAVNTVLTLTSPGSTSTETGAVVAAGTGQTITGDAMTGASQTSLRTLGSLGITNTASVWVVLNAVEPAGDSISVDRLSLSFYGASGNTLFTGSLASPVTLSSTATGVGNSGFVFALDSAQSAAAQTAIAGSGTSFANVRVGLSASLSQATGGPETFFVANGNQTVVTPVPEPQTYAMMLAGLGVIGTLVRRRRRVD